MSQARHPVMARNSRLALALASVSDRGHFAIAEDGALHQPRGPLAPGRYRSNVARLRSSWPFISDVCLKHPCRKPCVCGRMCIHSHCHNEARVGRKSVASATAAAHVCVRVQHPGPPILRPGPPSRLQALCPCCMYGLCGRLCLHALLKSAMSRLLTALCCSVPVQARASRHIRPR